MDPLIEKKLLKDKRVVDEINRHLWIESEKVGRDRGFEWAKEDWLKNFSKAWVDYHMPKQKNPTERHIASEISAVRYNSSHKMARHGHAR